MLSNSSFTSSNKLQRSRTVTTPASSQLHTNTQFPSDRTRSLSLSLLYSNLPHSASSPDLLNVGSPLREQQNFPIAGTVLEPQALTERPSRVIIIKNYAISGLNALLNAIQRVVDVRAILQSSDNSISNLYSSFHFLFFTLDDALRCWDELARLRLAFSPDRTGNEPLRYNFTDIHSVRSDCIVMYDHDNDRTRSLANYLNQGIIEIAGIPESIELKFVLEICSEFGRIRDVQYENTERLWIVEYEDTRIAEKALISLNGLSFGNYTLETKVSRFSLKTIPNLNSTPESYLRSRTPDPVIQHQYAEPILEPRLSALKDDSYSANSLRKYASTGSLGNLYKTGTRSRVNSANQSGIVQPNLTNSQWDMLRNVSINDIQNAAQINQFNNAQKYSTYPPFTSPQEKLASARVSQLNPSNLQRASSAQNLVSEMSRMSINSRPSTPVQDLESTILSGEQWHHQIRTHSAENLGSMYTQRMSPHLTRSLSHSISAESFSEEKGRGSQDGSSGSRSGHRTNELNMYDIAMGIDKRTTFMIRNIPNKFTQQMLIDFINETHYGEYDFIYLRIDFVNQCNVGYSFINFAKPESVISFAKRVVGMKWGMFNSEKVCMLSYANIQGKQALINKFRNSSVMLEDPSWRPKIFYTSGPRKGQEEEFPVQETYLRPRSNVLFSRENAWVPKLGSNLNDNNQLSSFLSANEERIVSTPIEYESPSGMKYGSYGVASEASDVSNEGLMFPISNLNRPHFLERKDSVKSAISEAGSYKSTHKSRWTDISKEFDDKENEDTFYMEAHEQSGQN